MKILRISLKNIASLAGLHTVDFTREPLADTGLFAICGQTGSGKSTLLDALCLSLYEKTPRLCSGERAARMQDGENDIDQKDVRNLLRRGTGEGFTEVAFIGVDNQPYTARWTVRRARNRNDGALQGSEMTLFRGNLAPGAGGEVEQGGRRTEVLPAIRDKVGLSFEQFTRAVLLAQNDFATFLKASDKDRAEILQALTGTERFGDISKAVFERAAKANADLKALKATRQGAEPLSEDALKLAQEERDKAVADLKVAEDKLAERERHAKWFVDLGAFSAEVAKAESEHELNLGRQTEAQPRQTQLAHNEFISVEARTPRANEWNAERSLEQAVDSLQQATRYRDTATTLRDEKRTRLNHAVQTLEEAQTAFRTAEPLVKEALALDAQLEPLKAAQEKAQGHLREAQATAKNALDAKNACEKQCANLETELTSTQKKRLKLERFVPFLPDRLAWRDRLEQALSARQDLEKATVNLGLLKKAAQEKADSEQRQAKTHQTLTTELERLSTLLEEARTVAKTFDAAQIATEQAANQSALKAVSELKTHLKNWNLVTDKHLAVEKEITERTQELEREVLRESLVTTKLLPEASLLLDSAKKSFELAATAVDAASAGLREKLENGKECPVCGAKEHPYAAHAPTEELVALKALRADTGAKQDAWTGLVREQASLAKSVKTASKEIAAKAEELKKLAHELHSLNAFVPVHTEAVSLWATELNARRDVIEARLGALESTAEQITVRAEAHRAAEMHLKSTLEKRDAVEKQVSASQRLLSGYQRDAAVALTNLANAKATHETRQNTYTSETGKLAPLWTMSAKAEAAFEEDARRFQEHFLNELEQLAGLEEELKGLQESIAKAQADLIHLANALNQADAQVVQRARELDVATNAYTVVHTKRSGLFHGQPVHAIERTFQQNLDTAEKVKIALSKELEEAELTLKGISSELNSIEKTAATARAALAAATLALESWLTAFFNRTGTKIDRAALDRILLLDNAWFAHERAALEAIKADVAKSSGALSARQSARQVHLNGRPTADDETLVKADLPLLAHARNTLKSVLEDRQHHLRTDAERRSNAMELDRQIAEHARQTLPLQKLDDLIGSADGAKFRNIAQRRTLDVLLGYANAQLDLLAGRYRLERIPRSLNLLMVDRDMADERRSVHSLSGGESFLVSLALALGLASLTSNRLRIESLFIDEGFGSLDPETLSTATNALMHLQAQGRKVGVISHVTEMAEAISVQIRVLKGRSGASRIEVPGAEPVAIVEELVQAEATPRVKGGAGEPNIDPESVAEHILSILRQAAAGSGEQKVSTKTLRSQIGCSPEAFNAGRDLLGSKVALEGRSLRLN